MLENTSKIKTCKDCENMTDKNSIKIENNYIIDGYVYTYKKDLKEDNISLRCKFRTICGTLLTINRTKLNDMLNG